MRATMSLALPRWNGLITWIDRVGQLFCRGGRSCGEKSDANDGAHDMRNDVIASSLEVCLSLEVLIDFVVSRRFG